MASINSNYDFETIYQSACNLSENQIFHFYINRYVQLRYVLSRTRVPM